MPHRLTAEVVLPADSSWDCYELRLLVDGEDVVGRAFTDGPATDPDDLLGPRGPLVAPDGLGKVRLAVADCTEGCCGALYVHVSRDGDQIVWDRWHNTGSGADPGMFRFDAGQYEAELARVHELREWEPTGRTVARLVRDLLLADAELLARWDCGLDFVTCSRRRPDEVEVSVTSPPRPVVDAHYQEHGELLEHDQLLLTFTVGDAPPDDQALRIAEPLLSRNPRRHKRAVRVGGYQRTVVAPSEEHVTG